MKYDFIIVGGGSAGCVLANRLSTNPENKVLVLEAGRPDYWWDFFIHMPAALTYPIGSKSHDWCYSSEPEPFMNGRRIYHARGKVLGGSSSINGMIFIRGNPMDYEKWSKDKGLEDWDYAHCLPYFQRSETRVKEATAFRGFTGPLGLEIGPCQNPLFQAFFKAVQEAGYPLTDDVNGYQQEGFGPFDRNISRGRRLSAARAYLHPVLKRPNLNVKCRTLTTRVLFEKKRTVGVEFRRGGSLHRVFGKEIILCGGAYNSPQLLQLSGIGPSSLLTQHGIRVIENLKGVGENLQDHLEVYVQYACKKPVSLYPALLKRNRLPIGYQWLFKHKGPAATNHFEAGGFIRSNDDVEYPNLQFHFLPVAIRYDGTSPSGGHGYQVHVGPMNSDARGRVQIRSNDPTQHPSLVFNYLSTQKDRREWVEAIHKAREIMNQPALTEFNGGEISPGPNVQTDKEILDWVSTDGETALHPCSTARMGRDEAAVVDPKTFQVYGVEGLRVVDASVIPYVTNGNLYAPVMMLAEKASDLILGNTPLQAIPLKFFRHEKPLKNETRHEENSRQPEGTVSV